MSERVNVKVLLLIGREAEIVADADDATTPERYPAVEIAAAVSLPEGQLPGTRLTARVGAGHRLFDWRLASDQRPTAGGRTPTPIVELTAPASGALGERITDHLGTAHRLLGESPA
ncbi:MULTISPECIES: hypothetical protein [unclassified Streptomyces]|uniref:hypothetical protein n=1 Tax=unclassified Streptomyces TaxID=2593676 RepID=UPI001F0EE06B|nr:MULTISPECIES: hypothetical protein [unclassified Streptomyces]